MSYGLDTLPTSEAELRRPGVIASLARSKNHAVEPDDHLQQVRVLHKTAHRALCQIVG